MKGSSAPPTLTHTANSTTQTYSPVTTEHVHMHQLYVWVSACVYLPCCHDNLMFFFFCLPLELQADSRQRKSRKRNRRRTDRDIVLGLSVWHPQLSHLLSPIKQQMFADRIDTATGRGETKVCHHFSGKTVHNVEVQFLLWFTVMWWMICFLFNLYTRYYFTTSKNNPEQSSLSSRW